MKKWDSSNALIFAFETALTFLDDFFTTLLTIYILGTTVL